MASFKNPFALETKGSPVAVDETTTHSFYKEACSEGQDLEDQQYIVWSLRIFRACLEKAV